MNRIHEIREQAKKYTKRIVLPEGDEPRVREAAASIRDEKIADVILLSRNTGLKGVETINPEKFGRLDDAAETLYRLRKHKGMTEGQAMELVLKDNVYFAALLTRLGLADGFVAGASHTTGNVARAAIHCLEMDKGINIVSSSFLIEISDETLGAGGLFVFADCGIVPQPDANQLADIALSSSRLFRNLFDMEPKVALLSYSTRGSSKGPSVDKVREALKIIREKEKNIAADGELQLDSAIVPDVAKIKCPKSPVAGKANVLIFPNLDAGNIAYKLVQRLAEARVVGPLLEGLTKPSSDLSRGCGVQEIVDAVAVTSLRAQRGC